MTPTNLDYFERNLITCEPQPTYPERKDLDELHNESCKTEVLLANVDNSLYEREQLFRRKVT